jgi:gliding motility-associated-like protein
MPKEAVTSSPVVIATPMASSTTLPKKEEKERSFAATSSSNIAQKTSPVIEAETVVPPVSSPTNEDVTNPSPEQAPTLAAPAKTVSVEEKKPHLQEEVKAVSPVHKKTEEEKAPEETGKKTKPTMESYVFEPNRETWEVPTHTEKSGKLSIFDKNGHAVYRREFSKMEKITWDGTALTGGMLASTMYVYLLEYSDGTTQQGTVTLSY